MARPTKAKAIERLQKALDAIPELKQLRPDSAEFKKWRRNTQIAITNTFEDKSPHIQDFTSIYYSPMFVPSSEPERQEAYVRGLGSAAPVLESMIEEIEEYWEDEPRQRVKERRL